ncbi:MAG: Zn-dependent oligopeptidase [Elusimicrobia bacterium]|nr:Zn-dependent oligopeptidase [Elusimicrobiota bacterium]
MKRMLPLALSVALFLPVVSSAQVVSLPGAASRGLPAPVAPSVRFDFTPAQIGERYAAVTASLNSELARIVATAPQAATFANTVKPFEEATAVWAREIVPMLFLSSVSPDPAVRAAAHELEKRVGADSVALSHREDLYRVFEAAAAKNETLDPADRKLMDTTVKGFRENGFSLPLEQRERLKAVQERLGDLAAEFGRNIDERKDELVVGEDGVKGLPADFVATLERDEQGRYKVPVDEPSLMAYMRYAESSEHRQAYLTKFDNRGGERNVEVLREALQLRGETARLLGYKDYPTMALKDRMAGTPERVLEFLNRVKDAVMERARRDTAEVLEMKRRLDPSATELNAWDRMFYARKLREERYALDAQQVKQYFPVDRVVEGTMSVYQKVLGVTFREIEGGPKWAEGVRLFEISDTKTGRRIGHFYLDLTPREGKHGHPAAYPLVSGRARPDGTYEEPVSAMVADFPKAAPGRPSLLSHGDVETFFHEFGHLMHQTLTTARYSSFSGSSVALDFVEAPSQMLENFIWDRGVLDELSGHWETGAKLPQELFEKMLASRSFMEGASYAGQTAYALGDLILHSTTPADPSAVFDRIIAEITGVATTPATHFVSSFDHLMGGYGSGYYAYLWSKVFAQDIFTLFKAAGVVSPEVGARYRKEILEVGSERPEMDSLRAFLGREPSEQAFMDEVRGTPPQASASAAPTEDELAARLEKIPGLAAFGLDATEIVVFVEDSAPADTEAKVRAALADFSLPARVVRGAASS